MAVVSNLQKSEENITSEFSKSNEESTIEIDADCNAETKRSETNQTPPKQRAQKS
jgi:hypothetical protein